MMHEGHRNRVRKKFLETGIDSFEDHEVLELILFYAIPRKNTNEIAHKLLETFGSIPAILDAPIGHLKKVPGMGDSAATFIKLLTAVSRLYLEKQYENLSAPLNEFEAKRKLVAKFVGRNEEAMAMILFDAKGKIVYDGIVSHGSINAVDVYMRKMLELIIFYNASSVLIAHNHPSGLAVPSVNDTEVTKKMSTMFSSIGVDFIDHIVVADGDYVSMKECKIPGIFNN